MKLGNHLKYNMMSWSVLTFQISMIFKTLYQVIQIWLEQSDNPTLTELILAFEGPLLQNRRMADTILEYLSKPEVYENYVSY